ncbi:DUF222 domain-containing protein [Nocardioidaceae bacterium]|nr:DUF222 domain-containing protein [Nocardioidaceae bacterium]
MRIEGKPDGWTGPTTVPVSDLPAVLPSLPSLLSTHEVEALDESALLELIGSAERAKSALAALQARASATLHNKRCRREEAGGVPQAQRGRGLASEIALARRESPHKGSRLLGLARALVEEMPHPLAALQRGDVTEWRATVVVKETAVLTAAHRRTVDGELADRLPDLGDRRAGAAARAIGYRLDPGSSLRRVRGAHADRCVTVRPAPDTMTHLTGFLPVKDGVACHTALTRAADAATAAGDDRTRSQLMADLLVERVTGVAPATGTPVALHLVMDQQALLAAPTDAPPSAHEAAAETAAHLDGYGPIPAWLARRIVRDSDRVWLRRLFTDPVTGQLAATDSRAREFRGALRRLLVLRDQTCRTPWCDAPVRHLDHATAVSDGGQTTYAHGQGLCARCNYAKELDGWSHRPEATGTTVRGPTGHSWFSPTPVHRPPGRAPAPAPSPRRSPAETHLAALIAA